MSLEKNTRRQIAQNEIMISFYSALKYDEEKADAENQIKIENLKTTNKFNRQFLDHLC